MHTLPVDTTSVRANHVPTDHGTWRPESNRLALSAQSHSQGEESALGVSWDYEQFLNLKDVLYLILYQVVSLFMLKYTIVLKYSLAQKY